MHFLYIPPGGEKGKNIDNTSSSRSTEAFKESMVYCYSAVHVYLRVVWDHALNVTTPEFPANGTLKG